MSILGTLAATAILAGVRTEWPSRAAAPLPRAAVTALPSLTSGGKFAARAEAGANADAVVTLIGLPPILPMFTAPSVPDLGLARVTDQPAALAAAVAEAPAPAKPPRPLAARHEVRHLAAMAAQPPRPAPPAVIAMARLPDLSGAGAGNETMWSRSKLAYRQVAAWSGTLVDHLLP